jgi:ribonuclease H2 subunit C
MFSLISFCKNPTTVISKFYSLALFAGTQSDGTTVLEAGFRGRFMKGSEVSLPEGFSGAVLEKKEGSNGTEATTSYSATATFSSFTYWNHDTAPVATDGVRRAMEWAALASHIHRPVDPKDVEAAVAKKQTEIENKNESTDEKNQTA